jgi:PAS domain S-box-containing protein
MAFSRRWVNNLTIQGGVVAILLFLLIISSIFLTIYIYSRKYLFQPLTRLENSTRLISQERFDTPIDTSSNDEIGQLARSFDQMIKRLKSTMASRAELEDEINERKRAETALKESEKKYRDLFNNAQVGLSRTRISDGQVLESNEKMAQIFGYRNAKEFIEKYVFSENYVDPEVRKWLLSEIEKNGVVNNVETQFYTKNRSKIWVRFDSRIFFDQGYMEDVVTDITEQKQAEAEREKLQIQLVQSQKMESVGRLAGGVAHDFNNMLGVILGHAELAVEQVEATSPVHDDLIEIQKAAQRSADLTRQLLAFARKQTAVPKVLDLNDTISGMLKMLRRLIGEDIDLVWMPGASLWPVKMDPTQIDQILANLSVNARDAISGIGNITIETENVVFDDDFRSIHGEFKPGQYVMLSFSDNGHGMDKETLENLFEPFFTTKEVGEGTGLGLATVYGIVKQNNGQISVSSELGLGSTFKIYIPRTQETLKKDEPDIGTVSKGTETVLFVEDEPSILRLGQSVLERFGYTVLAAGKPSDALTLAEQHDGPIHILVTDVVMPEMDGKELKEQIEKRKPGIKVLFMSGYTADVIVHRGILEEDVDFLSKPFTVNNLIGKVREMLDGPISAQNLS